MRQAPRVAFLLEATRGFDRGLLAGIVRYAMLHGPWTFYRPPHIYLGARSRFAPEELAAWKPDGAFCPVAQLDTFTPLGVPLIAYDVNEYSRPLPAVLSADLPAGRLCANDDRAESVFEICRVLGLGVPENVSVLGVDDDQYVCQLQNPPLSSVGMATERGGYEAAALLDRLMRGQEQAVAQRILVHATGVTERQSTSVLLVRDPAVRQALRFIRENASWAVRVADVVWASELSHRTLNERFHAELGCSIKRQLTDARIAYISRLLLQTNTPIREIAATAGYEDDRHFARFFKRATGKKWEMGSGLILLRKAG